MNRKTKQIIVFVSGIIYTVFHCEFLIYYLVISQCEWPLLKHTLRNEQVLKALIIADPHLLGPFRGHWLDKWRREWQMYQAFQAIATLHKPEAVFVLGDLFDEGEWTDSKQFNDYVDRFFEVFSHPGHMTLHVVAGNHDIGFHNQIRRGSAERFSKYLNAPSVQFIKLKDNLFVLMNSMALEGDFCHLCSEARKSIEIVTEKLQCAEHPRNCHTGSVNFNYSRPIFMQHFPLYRKSDAACTEPDAPPLPDRNKRFRLKIDAISKDATEYIVTKIKPRAVFGGHTHHGCLLNHSFKVPDDVVEFYEYSVPSFSWRNRPDPKYMLVSFSPDEYSVNKCSLPRESAIAFSAIVLLLLTLYFTVKRRTILRRFR